MIRGVAALIVLVTMALLSCTSKKEAVPPPNVSVSAPIPPRVDRSDEPPRPSRKVETRAMTTDEDLDKAQSGVNELTAHTNKLLMKFRGHKLKKDED